MLIGKTINIFVISIVLFLAGCASWGAQQHTQPPEAEWWVAHEFKAADDSIYNTPLSEVNPDWKKVSVFDDNFFKQALHDDQYKTLQNSHLVFTANATLDDEPSIETFLVGVYESYSGERGRFLAISRDNQIVKYFTQPGFSGYSSIYLGDDYIRWYKCMDCNDYDVIVGSKNGYFIQ